MAKKITDLTAVTSVKTTDVLPIVDIAANATKKATVRQILEGSDGIVATISGSTFTGAITAPSNGGFTGSLTKLVGGAPFITTPYGNIITITTGSGGQIILSGTGDGTGAGGGAPTSAQYLTLATDGTLSAERVFTPSTGLKTTDAGAGGAYTLSVNDGVVATLTGSTFSGPITAVANGGITGSITRLVGGAPFITVVPNNIITITTGSGGQIILSGTGDGAGAGGGAPTSAQYLTLATDASLSAERVLVPSTGLKATDGGANGNYTLTVHDGTFAALTGSNFSGNVTFASPAVTATSVGTDVFVFMSGSCGLTGSSINTPATRKAIVFGGDIMLSGTYVHQRPTQAPKAYFLQHNSQSVITAVGPTTVFQLESVPSGAFKVSVEAAATHATPSLGAGGFSCWSAFVNNLGTVTQLGAIGGVATGTFGGSGASAWALALDASGNKVRLLISGSSATSTWAWWLTAIGSTP